jgi:anti-sigma B factor antagonist
MSVVRLRITGELDMATAGEVEERVVGALTGAPTPERVVLDLAGLTFCDSSGIDVLLTVRSAAERAGVDLRVTGAHGMVRRTLEITGVLDLLAAEP